MPSKTVIASSDALHDALEAKALGINVKDVAIDFPRVMARKRELVKEFADYRIEELHAFPLYEGPARFLSPTELQVGDDSILEAKKFIIATGSIVAPAPLPGLSEAGYIDSDAVLELEKVPESLIVLGGGYTACELGQFLARMGAKSTMLIRSGHLLTAADDDVGEALTEYFREEGINVMTGITLCGAGRRNGKKFVSFVDQGVDGEIEADEIFYALGRIPDIAGLDLERADVRYHNITGIEVDETLRTSNPNIFAIGDCTGMYLLVHVAIYQGEIAGRNAATQGDVRADYSITAANTVFSDPQIAHVGKSEKDLQRAAIPYVVGRYDFAEHGKAECLAKTKGFVKIMAAPDDGRILGATVIGTQGSELIHELIVAMTYRSTVKQFMRIPHLHPTLAEIWTYPAEDCAEQIELRAKPKVAAGGTAG
jgi:pyruvate/2-oxoglutarate dehydrogenase complex dihydrolipoamide dehydrogenase (E3) component